MSVAYEHNGQAVSAEAFYAIACDPQRNVAVQACAGAGKTWMLVSRILRALLEGAEPQEILAITFTKKAAGEMRARLHDGLRAFAGADPITLAEALMARGVVHEKGSKPLLDMANKLSNLYPLLLDKGRQVQIRTFHSWFAALLRSAPLAVLEQLELPADYELLEDDSEAKKKVWPRFYAALIQDARARADFELVVYECGRSQTEKALAAALDKRTEFVLADARAVVETSVKTFAAVDADFSAFAVPEDALRDSVHRQTLLAAARVLGASSAKTFSAKGQELEVALAQGDLQGVLAALLTGEMEPRKFNEKVMGIQQVRLAQDLALRILAAQRQHIAWGFQQRMTRLTRILIQTFSDLKRELGWVDMNDIERAAQVLLGDPVLSGWIQERLDARTRHLLIDEFQDTNPLQWQALQSWLSAYAGAQSRAPSVFLVGDPKQSIYRFRRAEPQVFLAAQAFVRDILDGDIISCDHTRRNAHAVIAAVNAVMQDASEQEGYPGFRTHTTASTQSGRVMRLPVIARDLIARAQTAGGWRNSLTTPRQVVEETLRTLEARQAANWIAHYLDTTHDSMGGRLQPQDIMVLSRKRAGLVALQTELTKLGLPAQVTEKVELMACCEVQDMVALLDVLVTPEHDLSLARALKSPLFGLTDSDLMGLALRQQSQKVSWFELLQKEELYTKEGIGVYALLARFKTLLDRLPPHDALHAIYTQGDVLAQFAAAAPAHLRETVLNNLKALLNYALQLNGGRYATPYAFVRALKSGGLMAPPAVSANAVQLLTIHGAKGLEAHTVLVLDTDAAPRNAQTMSVLIDWPGESSWPVKFIYLLSESRPPSCAEHSMAAELAERSREELNATYVAMTRACDTLVISGIEPHKDSGRSLWKRLFNVAQPMAGVLNALTKENSPLSQASPDFYIQELPKTLMNSQNNAIKIEASAISSSDSDVTRIGLAMHRLLEWGSVSSNNTASVVKEFELSEAQGAQAAELAQNILNGEGAWAWDSHVLEWQGNEVELFYQGEPLRLDRLVSSKHAGHGPQWWVLDFKMSFSPQDQPDLVEQLLHYKDAVQALYPDEHVRAAFLAGNGSLIEL